MQRVPSFPQRLQGPHVLHGPHRHKQPIEELCKQRKFLLAFHFILLVCARASFLPLLLLLLLAHLELKLLRLHYLATYRVDELSGASIVSSTFPHVRIEV